MFLTNHVSVLFSVFSTHIDSNRLTGPVEEEAILGLMPSGLRSPADGGHYCLSNVTVLDLQCVLFISLIHNAIMTLGANTCELCSPHKIFSAKAYTEMSNINI